MNKLSFSYLFIGSFLLQVLGKQVHKFHGVQIVLALQPVAIKALMFGLDEVFKIR